MPSDDARNRIEELCKLFREGVESGPRRPADEILARLEAKYRRMTEQRKMTQTTACPPHAADA